MRSWPGLMWTRCMPKGLTIRAIDTEKLAEMFREG